MANQEPAGWRPKSRSHGFSQLRALSLSVVVCDSVDSIYLVAFEMEVKPQPKVSRRCNSQGKGPGLLTKYLIMQPRLAPHFHRRHDSSSSKAERSRVC